MADEPREFDRSAVLTIQGGGLHGLSLLGQLDALDRVHKIVPVGIAGTSAGAIVATLYWAKLRPANIKDKLAKLADAGKLLDLLGSSHPLEEQFSFADFCELAREGIRQLEAVSARIQPSKKSLWSNVKAWFRWIGSLWSLGAFSDRIAKHVARCGVFCGDNFEHTIDDWLRSSEPLRQYTSAVPSNRLIEFGDLRDARLPPLFITATNLSTGELELFNSVQPEYSNVPIARAVRASISFPGFFRPVNVKSAPRDGWYVDGGVISNFPAWVFSHEIRRLLDSSPNHRALLSRPWIHFGLRLGPEDPGANAIKPTGAPLGAPSPTQFAKSLLSLVRYQARNALESQLASFVSRSIHIDQPINETGGPTHFLRVDEVTGEMVRDMFRRGASYASTKLRGLSYALPAVEKIEPHLELLVQKALAAFRQPDNSRLKLRSNVFLLHNLELLLRYSVHMDDDADRNLHFHFTKGLTGFCFVNRRPQLCNLKKIRDLAEEQHLRPEELFGMPHNQHIRVRKDRTWLASVPIFDPYATYQGDLGLKPSLEHNSIRGSHYHEITSSADGAVLGVLNLDAALPYEELGLSDDPAVHWTDVQIRLIVDSMQVTASKIANELVRTFGVIN